MFPNTDNNLGITAVRKALYSRSSKFPSTDCIAQAVEICLRVNNCHFSEQNFVQKHGTAMGPKNACSYADLAMGIIDEKAKSEGSLKPLLWWRYRDDIFDLWTQGLPKLLEFTDYINSLYPTIKFELVYSDSFLHVLDLTLHLKDGLIVTDIYSKPTDSHLYLPFSSSHPSHCKRAIPYGVALRIKRNCSTHDFLQIRREEYKRYLKSQNYPANLVDKQFDKALEIPRSELLSKKVKTNKKVFPLVLDYNPILPDIQSIIRKHVHLSFFKAVNSQSKLTAITSKPLMVISDVLRKLDRTRRNMNLEPGDAERMRKKLETRLAERLRVIRDSGDIEHPKLKSSFNTELEKLEERKKGNEDEKPKLDKEIRQKQEERNREKEKLQMAISTALDEWIGSEGWWK